MNTSFALHSLAIKSLLTVVFMGFWLGSLAQNINNDSTATDTVQKKYIVPDTRRILTEEVFTQTFQHKPVRVSFADFQYWEDLDTLTGVTNHLGQVGKPYQHFRFGVQDRWFSNTYWRNPLTNAPNLYILNPESQARYYDSKTPYVNINFAQGPQQASKNITLLEVTTSFNVTPFVNLTGYYKRRQSESIYGNNTADNRLMYLNGYYHNYSRRFSVFSTAQYNEFYQLYNGGTYRSYGSSDDDAFVKGGESVNLSQTTGKWIIKSITAEPIYHLIRQKDSLKSGQKLSFCGLIQHEYTRFRFGAENLSASQLSSTWVPALPTFSFANGITALYEKTETYRYRARANALYGFNLRDYIRIELRGGLEYNRLFITQKDSGFHLTQNSVMQKTEGKIMIPKLLGFQYDVLFYTRPSNLFNPETYWENTANLRLPFTLSKDTVKDASGEIADKITIIKKQAALQLNVHYLLHSQNPSIFQMYLPAGYGNRYGANNSLKNQQINHLRAELKWEGFPKIQSFAKGQDTLLNNYLSVQPFLSQLFNMIYYNDTLQSKQAPSNSVLTFTGMEIKGRLRLYKKFYTEGNIGLQVGGLSNVSDSLLWVYSQSQPNYYGKVSLFYQNERTGYKGVLRTGIDFRYSAAYYGNGFDPVSGEFFPVNPLYPYIIKGYPRIDVYFSTRIKRAYLFFKLVNITDGLLTKGNYTTPFYPVQPRMISLGMNWTFFD